MMTDWTGPYETAILAAVILCLVVLAQSFLGAILGIVLGREQPGGKLQGDFAEFGFRTLRTHLNSVENLSVFALTLVLAMALSVDPKWVNWLAMGHVGARILHWAVYYAGIGPNAAGPRTLLFVIGWLFNVILAVMTLMAALG